MAKKPKKPRRGTRYLLPFVALLLGALSPQAFAQSSVSGPPNAILCNQIAQFTGSGALATLVTGVTGKITAICGWHVTSTTSTTTTFQLEYGTNAACALGTTAITPALNVTITAPSADHIDYASTNIPAGDFLCINASATVNGVVYYAQF